MIGRSLVETLLADIRRTFATAHGLLSATVHGSYAVALEERSYVDIDLIFVFSDDALQTALSKIDSYFSRLTKEQSTANYRALYRVQSGPMHPLRPPDDTSQVPSLRSVPVIFFHVSVFPRSFYCADNRDGERPSRLLLYSWQSLHQFLGMPLGELTTVERLAPEDVRFEGLGIRDCLGMIRTHTRNFWDWEPQANGVVRMVWKSTSFSDLETFELPLYAFKWCITNSVRLLRDRLPIRKDLSDLDVFLRFILPRRLHDLSRTLHTHLERLDELRVRFTDDPVAFWNSLAREWLYNSVTAILEDVDQRLGHISNFIASEYSFSVHGQKVPITINLDLRDILACTMKELRPDRVLLVVDKNLKGFYDPGDLIPLGLLGYFPGVVVVSMDPSEKSLEGLKAILQEAERRGLTSSSVMITFGGGGVGNTGGTAAGLVCRGTRLVHIPTTLVAQCDSAIGVKQSVNGMLGKNYLGLFHAPEKVVIQPLFLLSLEYAQACDGLVEALKHGLCQDSALVERVLEYVDRKDEQPFDVLAAILKRTIELKLEFLRVDPLENDARTHLELGHKLGHAVEFLSGGHMSHGQSVAFGMLAESILFNLLGKTSLVACDYLRNSVLKLISPNNVVQSLDPRRVADQLWHDNKRSGASLSFSYLAEPQRPESLVFVMDDDFLDRVAAAVREAKGVIGCRA